MTQEDIVEALAAHEHEQWAHWTAHMLDNTTPANIKRWRRQITAPYAELPEAEKRSDRLWANAALSIAKPLIEQALIEEMMKELTPQVQAAGADAIADAIPNAASVSRYSAAGRAWQAMLRTFATNREM